MSDIEPICTVNCYLSFLSETCQNLLYQQNGSLSDTPADSQDRGGRLFKGKSLRLEGFLESLERRGIGG